MLISLAVAAAIVALFERVRRIQLRRQPLFREFFATDVVYLLTGFVAGGSIAVAYVAYASDLLGAVLSLPRLSDHEVPLWLEVVLAVLALDAGNYLSHYCLHRFDTLWEFHKVHHSSRELDWLATFRSHIVEQILRRLLAPVLLVLFGFPLNSVLIAGAILVAWGILNHANLKLNMPTIEMVLITPRLHRIHHFSNAPTNNLGTLFIFWDKLRGTLDVTHYESDRELGNGEPNYPQNWLRQFVKPLRAIATTSISRQMIF
jgi:sterol desaturase/sphingolipid hydroxylase (fatty acid hydroxylase superfamily)